MDSPQSVVSPCKNSLSSEHEKQKSDCSTRTSAPISKEISVNGKDAEAVNGENSIGVLHVYIHEARDIHNICIYHKQDVYAKLCLTSDPEKAVSTTIINGGGRNPVFNEKLQLNIRTVESSLKCEIWMLSRVRNYLEDQLLGFALVPLSEVLMNNGKLEKEFSLSSTDLFHSPAGFVQLSLNYTGASPEMIMATHGTTRVQDSEISESLPSELDKIEFPDPKIVNEDEIMVSEYIQMPCNSLESDSSESLVNHEAEAEAENQLTEEVGAQVVESFSTVTAESVKLPKVDSPPSSVSTNGVSSPSVPASSESSEAPAASKSPNQEQVSALKEKNVDGKGSESDSSGGLSSDSFTKPVVSVNIEPEQKVVQQEIVEMYMKSMQQFTESLAKMKLPMDMETGKTNSENSSSDSKVQSSKNSGSRVFYGSRAFF
ncbi:hypothetical protein CsatB_014767 [Cannabis sativa]|uniref:C2 domain-containing protein n=2 Tax=Cannabis sativa TaxID=3483 RepID=A0A7J6GEI0_CANSA|nr:uncharacterized protein LOC115725548 [Cannabis sativa]XP_030510967.1 uncharacterized protein LOC115725548 [Cannabis sativa]XP_030510968.1 uncharacterized protein LOC115725548 [Cannabis sativa]KAF4381232.1 hypothetical protein G4B88_015498 [Cannabis sativa]